MHQTHNVKLLGPKIGRAQYGNSQWNREDGKDKKSEENRKDERDERSHWRNKVDPMVEKNNSSEAK